MVGLVAATDEVASKAAEVWGTAVSQFKMLCKTENSSSSSIAAAAAAGQSMTWMATPLYSNVASRQTRSRRAASLSVARLQSAGTISGLETKRSALGAHLSVDTYS